MKKDCLLLYLIIVASSLISSCNKNMSILGTYSDGILVIKRNDKTGEITGKISLSQGNPEINCLLFFTISEEVINQGQGVINLWDELKNKYPAWIEIIKDKVEIQSDSIIFPCQNILELKQKAIFFKD
jgi:hypothetical protein